MLGWTGNKSDLVAPANTPEEQPTGEGERNEHTQSSDTGFDRGNAVRAGCIRLRPAAGCLGQPLLYRGRIAGQWPGRSAAGVYGCRIPEEDGAKHRPHA